MKNDYDLIIIGAGFVGLTVALAFAAQGKKIALIEAQALNEKKQQHQHDGRAIALSLKSQHILEKLKIWPHLTNIATPITEVCVSQKGSFGKLYLTAESLAHNTLGYVVAAPQLGAHLLTLCEEQKNITWFSPVTLEDITQTDQAITAHLKDQVAISADRIIVAEGAQSLTRMQHAFSTWTRDYEQYAIVANISFDAAKSTIAYQRFTSDGTLALLPLSAQRFTSVWTVSAHEYLILSALSDDDYVERIQAMIGFQLGKAYDLGSRQAYPLKAVFVEKAYDGRLLLMGNAAHTLNPIAAQGFNLTLRDIECLLTAPSLSDYQQQRLADQKNMLRFTDGLVTLLSLRHTKSLCSLGLGTLNYLPFVKKRLFEHLLGY